VVGNKHDLEDLVQEDLHYNGGSVNATVMESLKLISTPKVESLMESLDREFGMDVLSGSYNKMKLFVNGVKNQPELAAWVLETMRVALRRKEVEPSDVLLQAYQKSRNNELTFIQTALATCATVSHMIAFAESVGSVDPALSQKLLDSSCHAQLFSTRPS
jgi:hypothetical protein